jgi:hypothetical protein
LNVQADGCLALSFLVVDAACRETIIASDGAALVVAAMSRHPLNDRVLEASSIFLDVTSSIDFFGNNAGRDAIVAAGAEAVIRDVLITNPRRTFQDRGHLLLQRLGNPDLMANLAHAFAANLQGGQEGASESRIRALPTYLFVSPADRGQMQETEPDKFTCQICLAEYNDGDELRTLPCFHRFHRGCIDQWLGNKSKCPTCRTGI